MTDQPELPSEPPQEVLPWEAVQIAFDAMLAAQRADPEHELQATKDAEKAYRDARAHANAVAEKAKPNRRRVAPDEFPVKQGRK